MTALRRRRILWTGGFDSTALVLDSIKRGIRVIPFYIPMSDNWQKQIRERDARGRIRHGLPAKLGKLLEPDVELVNRQLWQRLAIVERRIYFDRKAATGSADVAASYSPQLPLIVAAGELVPDLEAGYVANDESIRDRLQRNALASAVMIPYEHETKAELLEDARAGGYAELLGLTWSCEHDDNIPEACGECLPCRGRIIPQIVRAS